MKADYVHKDTLTATNYVELQKENELIVSYNQQLLKEKKELKKQLEEKENIACDWKDSYLENADKIEILEIQQKEFIKYLEDEINKWHYNYDSYNYEYEVEEPTAEELANKILQKYKEIIGGNNNDKII